MEGCGGSRKKTSEPHSSLCFMWSSHGACDPGASSTYLLGARARATDGDGDGV